jgi:aromatic ring-opening dioxygenase catalytic subunit (LigB family)
MRNYWLVFEVASNGLMPVLFIGHGSPMNIILDNDYTKSLVAAAKMLPKPEAIMVFKIKLKKNEDYFM